MSLVHRFGWWSSIVVAITALAVARASCPRQQDELGLEKARSEVERSLNVIAKARVRGDTKLVQEWANHARKVAQSLLEADTERAREPPLALVDCILAIGDDEMERAWSRAEDAHTITQSDLSPGDPVRVRALLLLGELNFRRKEYPAALEFYEQAAVETAQRPRDNAANRVEGLLFAAQIRMQQQAGEQAAAALLAEAWRLLPAGELLATHAQQLVANLVWGPMLLKARETARAGGDAVQTAETELRSDLDRFRKMLHDAKVDPKLASLGLLGLAQFQWECQRLDDIDATLAPLADAIDSPQVAPFLSATYWNLLGLMETERSNFALAREHYEKALDLCIKAGLRTKQALVLNDLGLLLLRQGDYRSARERLQVAVQLYTEDVQLKDDARRAMALLNLAKAVEGTDDYAGAARLLGDARSLVNRAARPEPYILCLCLNNFGINRYGVGKFSEAQAALVEAREVAVRAFGESHLHVAEIDVNLGWVALALDRPEQAEALFRKALTVVRDEFGDDHHRTAEILSYLARVLADRGQVDQARERIIEAIRLRERYLDRTVRSAFSERDRLAFVQALRVHPESSAWPGVLDTYLDLATQLAIPIEDQYCRLLAWKGVVARHALPRAGELEDDPEIGEVAARRETVLRKLRSETFARRGATDRKQHLATVAGLEAEASVLERQLRAQSPRFAHAAPVLEPTPAQVALALPAGSALLDVIEIRRHRHRKVDESLDVDRRYIAFVVRPDAPLARIELEDAPRIDNAVVRLHAALEHGDATAAEPAAELAERICSPLSGHLGHVDLLIVAGDGLLHRVPLAALPNRGRGSFWIDQMAFASVETAQSLMVRRGRAISHATGLVAVGGVDYGTAPGKLKYPPLEQTAAEADAVTRLFRESHPHEPVDLLKDAEPTKVALRELFPKRRFVHLATHGLFSAGRQSGRPFDPVSASASLDSALVLAGANLARDDQAEAILTAEEIGAMDLQHVELVTLSACETGLGHISAGQGVIGLLSALNRSGAATMVSALWKVEDEPTAALLTTFYRHLWLSDRSIGPAQALRAAQREMIQGNIQSKSGDSFTHPKYWAAFVVAGDPFAPPHR